MHKKLAATLAIAIFLIGTVAIIAPSAQATFTLGALSGTAPYDNRNFDPHVAGPIGYVWPGAGQCAWDGYPSQASDNCSPGYQSPYPNGNPPGAPSNSWYQLEGDTYAPFGAVLTNSTGDLVFALNATCLPAQWSTGCAASAGSSLPGTFPRAPVGPGVANTGVEIQSPLSNTKGWDTWVILIPPEFTVPGAAVGDPSQIVSTLGNSYANYFIAKLGPEDRYAPGWTMVGITADSVPETTTTAIVSRSLYYNHSWLNFTQAGEWYYARINGVTAPSIAGRYFFKMFLFSQFNAFEQLGVGPTLGAFNPANAYGLGCISTILGNCNENPGVWVPPQNWPVMLVKGETDPAIVTGTLRYAGYNSTLYQQPIAEAGMVWAHMTMRLDPYTGQQRPDLPTIDGQAFVNATANGHYELEGLAPGVYDIYAEAAGYPQSLCVSGITVLKGQSLHFDCYLQPGPVIHGNIYSKHQFGDEPWPGNSTTGQYMKIELYSNPTLSNIVDPSAGSPVSWSPLPCVAGGQEDFYGLRAAGMCGDPRDGSYIAFPWHEYAPNSFNAAYGEANTPFQGTTNGYSRDVAESVCFGGTGQIAGALGLGQGLPPVSCSNGKIVLTSDPMGVGPPQQWYVAGGTTTPFHFEMGVKGEYGAPRDLSGEVPQVYATWVNGLTPGRYYVRAWTFRYVQTALDGATFQEYYFDITPNEWAGDVTLPLDLRLSSWVNKTVYFHDTPNTLLTNPIHSGAGYLYGTLVGADGHVYSSNVTGLGLLEQNTTGINPKCFSGVSGYIASCPYLTGGQAVVPNYYYTPFGDTEATPILQNPTTGIPTNTAVCFFYEQKAYGFDASNGGTFASTTSQSGHGPTADDEFGAPSQPCPFGFGAAPGQEVSALDKSGINANSIATGEATIQFWGINDTWDGTNYGIPSGTYTPTVAANGYVSQTPAEQVSVTLSGNPTSISDHMFLGPGFNVSVYSIDWERPRVSRDWVWSGCQDAELAASYTSPGCIGSEIDVGFYPVVNGTGGTASDWYGADVTFQPPSVSATNDFGGLFQGPGGVDCFYGYSPSYSCAEMDGGGRNVLPGYSDSHFVYYGQAAAYADVGGYTPGTGFGYLTATWPTVKDSTFNTVGVVWPRAFAQGEYDLAAYTYGYIQDKDFQAYAMNGQVADMKVNLIIGVNVSLQILFKKESIITGTPYNMSGRVRLFNDQGQLVATWMSSEGVYVPSTSATLGTPGTNGHDVAANGELQNCQAPVGAPVGATPGCYPDYPFLDDGGSPYVVTGSGLNGYNFIPGGTTLLRVDMAGLPQQIPLGDNVYAGVFFGDPIFTPDSCFFGIPCYSAAYAQYPYPYTGIAGAPDYTGGWTAEVDFVPWYANNTGTPEYGNSFAPCTVTGGGTYLGCAINAGQGQTIPGYYAQYYPPVNGLLMGESYHIIPGTTATSGISLTEDAALSSTFVSHTMAPNHLGPYSQEGVWQIAGTHNSGEASAIFEVDLNGFVSGNVLAFTWSNEFRTLSWGTISVTGAPSGATWNFYTYDGIYQAFLPTGNYKFTIAEPGYAPQTWSVSISPGQTGTGQNVYLEQSNIPVPEFSGIAVVAFAALAASVYLLKRRRK